jgi:Domain of unknown function (DUF1833)
MVTAAAQAAVNASSTDVAFWFLLTITPGGQEPIRFVNNREMVSSRGEIFQPYPFTVVLPTDDDQKVPSVRLVIDNVDRAIVEAIRGQSTPPAVKLEVVTSTYPDIVERTIDFLYLRSVDYDALTITGTLEARGILNQRFPRESYTASLYPGIFY